MSSPNFKLLQDNQEKLARLITIRKAVEPLLATNYLSHFTDHSVNHSDQLCNLVDELATSLNKEKRLTMEEATILYMVCYFHDSGMQHQRAGETNVIREILCDRRWASLEIATQQEIIREQHHRISAELVLNAVRASEPAIGISLNDDEKPGVIAALCLAHCLNTDSEEYRYTTEDQGNIRVGLLSALFRLADILDESQRRTHLFLEQTRDLSLESRIHWWRHYYVSNITIHPHAITVWFDFPPARRAQYKELFEPLQIPWIEKELRYHSNVFAVNDISWLLQTRDTPEVQCTTKVMDDDLERYAVERAVARRSDQLRQERTATVTQLRVARPTVKRQLDALRESTGAPDELLGKAVTLAEHLSAIGGRRDAWMRLLSEFNRLKSKVSEEVCLNVALRLAEMMIDDEMSDFALRHLQEFNPHFSRLLDGNPMKLKFLRLWAVSLRDRCLYTDAVATFEEIARTSDQEMERSIAMAEIAEMHLLQGELNKLNNAGEAEIC
jgi:hypothetical protein